MVLSRLQCSPRSCGALDIHVPQWIQNLLLLLVTSSHTPAATHTVLGARWHPFMAQLGECVIDMRSVWPSHCDFTWPHLSSLAAERSADTRNFQKDIYIYMYTVNKVNSSASEIPAGCEACEITRRLYTS